MTTQIDTTTRPRRDRLSRRQRHAVLVLHIVFAVGWIGVDLALIPLVLTGLTTDDGPTAAAAFQAVAILVPWTVPALSLLILSTGILLGLGTKWGLVRYWWVAVKLVISLILTTLVFVSLLPAVTAIDVSTATSGRRRPRRPRRPDGVPLPARRVQPDAADGGGAVGHQALGSALTLTVLMRSKARAVAGRTTALPPRPG